MTSVVPDEVARALKPVDAWWTVVAIDPVASRLLPPLLRFRWITPNVVTGAAFLLGVAAVAVLASGHFALGAVLYELRFLFDCLDGKIARVRRMGSRRGAMLDRLADAVTVPAAFTAVTVVLAERGELPWLLVLAPAVGSLLIGQLEAVLELARGQLSQGKVEGPARMSGVVGWARRHRLTLRPWTVEAETVGLFLGPLLLHGRALAVLELGVVGSYGVFAVVDLALILRATTEADR
jgi:phosphatidylglycerophosphate synthase